ncbi:NAD(P)H-hydrate dehydratase [Egibacter rhizosphaerae]|uniref:Bifunctional NAD(P)H-hydrate repair enzyme n=1 Tax=Egibacter rhizosphaerae TaxID=1670831 RepID=A0A411YH84_9ACTN|nr:NAD(P)H-hydrate dehydratase [Egibacter rhizosphaerae]QBI20577.1 NAD(P)H-hydrate dehydratase [Egibacter rhizosphaerae]
MPTPLFTPAQVREMDARAFDRGTSADALMERAAGHLERAVRDLAGYGYGLRVTILCGKGNNGGDGLALARRLTDVGARATVCVVTGEETLEGLPAVQRDRWLARGGTLVSSPQEALVGADVTVDCLLGTGAAGEPRDPYRTAIAALAAERAQGTPVVACDVPSGVDAETGTVAERAVTADVTVTLGAEKVGLRMWPARGRCGDLVTGDLGILERRDEPVAWSLDDRDADHLLPFPPPGAHKRQRGRVLIVAGAQGMSGAAVLATRGAVEAGVGLVTCLAAPGSRDAVAGAVPEALTATFGDLDDRDDHDAAVADVLARAQDADVVVAGPGLGRGGGPTALVRALVERLERPLVLDADAVNALAEVPEALTAPRANALVLTPHEGELARLVDGPVQRNRASEYAADWGATVVAKGPGTVTASPDGRTWVCASGSVALATGGTGDVLSGMIGAVLAGDVDLARVAATVHWHGRAGEAAAALRHPAAVRAGAVADAVPTARARMAGDPGPRPGAPIPRPEDRR